MKKETRIKKNKSRFDIRQKITDYMSPDIVVASE